MYSNVSAMRVAQSASVALMCLAFISFLGVVYGTFYPMHAATLKSLVGLVMVCLCSSILLLTLLIKERRSGDKTMMVMCTIFTIVGIVFVIKAQLGA